MYMVSRNPIQTPVSSQPYLWQYRESYCPGPLRDSSQENDTNTKMFLMSMPVRTERPLSCASAAYCNTGTLASWANKYSGVRNWGSKWHSVTSQLLRQLSKVSKLNWRPVDLHRATKCQPTLSDNFTATFNRNILRYYQPGLTRQLYIEKTANMPIILLSAPLFPNSFIQFRSSELNVFESPIIPGHSMFPVSMIVLHLVQMQLFLGVSSIKNHCMKRYLWADI
jgi:hypothetical protein